MKVVRGMGRQSRLLVNNWHLIWVTQSPMFSSILVILLSFQKTHQINTLSVKLMVKTMPHCKEPNFNYMNISSSEAVLATCESGWRPKIVSWTQEQMCNSKLLVFVFQGAGCSRGAAGWTWWGAGSSGGPMAWCRGRWVAAGDRRQGAGGRGQEAG